MVKYSIIVITKDNCLDLKSTMESLKDFSNNESVEIIIVDGSKDINTNALDKIISDFPYCNYIFEIRKGISLAFNVGIENSKGEWLFFLNSGDILINKNIFNDLLVNIPEDVSICYGLSEIFDINKNKVIGTQGVVIKNWPPTRMPFNHQSVLYKKIVFKKYGVYDLGYNLAMDYEHLLRFKPLDFYFVNKIISRFYLGGSSSNKIAVYDEWKKAQITHGFSPLKANFYNNYYKFRLVIKKIIHFYD
jgi:glycosyltransferase involved in cell wall biosynthesis